MSYLVTQMLFCLLAATALGAAVAWLAARASQRRAEATWRAEVAEVEEERDLVRAELEARVAEIDELTRDQDRVRSESIEAERDLAVILGERDRALTRAVGLQEEVEALAEAFRDRNETVRRLQQRLEGGASAPPDAEAEILRLRAERDRLKRLLDETT